MATPPPSDIDLADLTRGAWSTFVWGASRAVTKRVLYALARANDPHLYWVDVRSAADPVEDPDPALAGWVPENHLLVTRRPEEARPQATMDPPALWSIVRSDEPERVLAQLSDFLRLPPIAQEIIARTSAGGGRHVVAVANVDRVRAYYPTSPEATRPVLDPFLAASILPFLGSIGTPSDARWAFDFVFEVRATDLRSWEAGWLVCEKAHAGTSFRTSHAIPLRSLPEVAEVLYGDDPIP